MNGDAKSAVVRHEDSSLAPAGRQLRATSIRAINRARIISLVRRRPRVTRADLSRRTGLSKGTVSNLVAELLSEGVLSEESGSGRRRNAGLWLNGRAGLAVGIELSPDECRAVVTDMEMNALQRLQRPLGSARVEQAAEAVAGLVSEALAGTAEPCLGVTVAVPGPTDAQGQTVIFSESLGWSDVPLAARLAERLPCPVSVVNRPRAGVLGEHWYGAGVGIDDLIYVSLSSGVAAGILIGGQLFTGAFGYNGEFGHTTILADGPQCICGNRGCLEAVASLPAIGQAIEGRLRRGEPSVLRRSWDGVGRLTYQEIIAAARDGDPLAVDEIRNASRYVGVGVANLIDLFNPSRVIVGGRLAEAGEIVLNTVRETAQRRAFPLSYGGVQIVRNGLGADSVCIGACALVVDRYIAEAGPALVPAS